MNYITSFIIVLGVLIFFHELGHFIMARLCGVGVEKFSLGFGPRLFGKTIGMTDYRISAIPLGGYVKMVGEEPDSELSPEEIPYSFTHKHVFKRMIIVAAGPLFNVLLAVLIFYAFMVFYGDFVTEPVVGAVAPDSPAMAAGIEKGDRITSIGDAPVDSFDGMAGLISQSKGRPIRIEIIRDGKTISMTVTPMVKTEELFGMSMDRYLIGISSSNEHIRHIRYGPIDAVGRSIIQTYNITRMTVVGIAQLITGAVPAKSVGGPILIAQMAGTFAEQGVASLLYFIALISINLAIINLMPIPVLDGGHLLFFFIEMVTRKPVSIKTREVAQQVGLFIIMLLIVFVFYNDISRILTGNG